MAETTRQQILDAVEVVLKTILVANAYRTGAGANVLMNHVGPVAETALPGILVTDSEEVKASTFCEEEHTITMTVTCLGVPAATGALAAKSARQVADDALKALTVDETFAGLAQYVAITRQAKLSIKTGEKFLGGEDLTMEIIYTTAIHGA